MSKTVHIHKAAGILIRDRKLLIERSNFEHDVIPRLKADNLID